MTTRRDALVPSFPPSFPSPARYHSFAGCCSFDADIIVSNVSRRAPCEREIKVKYVQTDIFYRSTMSRRLLEIDVH